MISTISWISIYILGCIAAFKLSKKECGGKQSDYLVDFNNHRATPQTAQFRPCSVEGCPEKHYGGGFCKKHHGHNYKFGHPTSKENGRIR